MASNIKHLRSLDALEKEIYRQRLKAKILEKKLDENFDYLHDNYSSLVKNSIFKSGEATESIAISIIRSLVGHERLQEALVKLANPLADKAAGLIDSLLARISKKETE